jgi:outer membrane murein-binding lipoprotein Lpp
MWTRITVVGALLLAALLLAGCDNRSADRKTMDTKFEQLDYQISNLELSTAATYNQPHFAAATGRYIRLVRHYADLLGPKEARKRLTEAADGISSYCLPCAGQLADEASRY